MRSGLLVDLLIRGLLLILNPLVWILAYDAAMLREPFMFYSTVVWGVVYGVEFLAFLLWIDKLDEVKNRDEWQS